MKRANAVMVDIDELQVVELLQDKMTGVVKNIGPRVLIDCIQESLEGRTVVQVFARMQLEAGIHAGLFEGVEQWSPAPRQFGKTIFHQACRPLWPRIKCVPQQRAGKRGMRRQAEIPACRGRQPDLPGRPFGLRRFIAVDGLGCECVEHCTVGRMRRHQLSLQVG